MRDIKIKFWDVENKCMHHWIENFEEIAIVNGKMKPVLNNSVSDNWNWYKRSYEPLQYTGLKDKNGKEIYEGDILKFFNDVDYIIKPGYAKVVFEDGAFCCKHYKYGTEYLANMDVVDMYITVAGNIYENPELLKGN